MEENTRKVQSCLDISWKISFTKSDENLSMFYGLRIIKLLAFLFKKKKKLQWNSPLEF